MRGVNGDRRVILTLGMHRSGTSALTRTLNLLGAGLPGTLQEPRELENPRGFWEAREVMEIHDRFLSAVGSRWNDIRPLPPEAFQGRPARQCRDELTAVLGVALGATPLVAVKDPRMCRLLPIWLGLLAGMGVDVQAVLPIRNPLEVAFSLQARNDIDRDQALMLWLIHTLLAERETRRLKRHYVTYSAFLDAPERAAANLAARLGWFDPDRIGEALPAIVDFWSAPLRHHVQADSVILEDPVVPTWVREVYDWSLRAADPERTADSAELDGLHREISRAMEAMEGFLAPALLDTPAHLRKALTEVEVRDERIARLDEETRRLTLQLEDAERAAVSRAEALLRAEEMSNDRLNRLNEARATIAGQAEQIARNEVALAGQARSIDGQARSIEEKDQILAHQSELLRQGEEDLLRRVKQAVRLEASLEEQARLLSQRDAALAGQGDLLRLRAEECLRLTRLLSEAEEALKTQSAILAEREEKLSKMEDALAAVRSALGEQETAGGLLREENGALTEELDTLRRERAREGDAVIRLRAAIRDLGLSLDRQRTHLAVLTASRDV